MSNEYIQATDDARRLLRGFKAFEEVARALELAGTAQQAQSEAEKALAGLNAQIEAAKVEQAEAKAAAKDAKAKAADAMAESKEKANGIVAEAQAQADAIKAESQAMLERANAEAEAIVTRATNAASVVRSQRDALDAEVNELQGKLDNLQAQIKKMLR